MILRMYAVFDKAVLAFHPPLCFRSEGEAKRAFIDALQGQAALSAHRSDYAFAYIGEFDDNLGKVTALSTGPIIVLEGSTAGGADPVYDGQKPSDQA